MLTLIFDKGTLVIRGDHQVPYSSWDPRIRGYRAMARHYHDILTYLDKSEVAYMDCVLDLQPCPNLHLTVELRDYQREALSAWKEAGKRGSIVLPTGSGKTIIALAAISMLNTPTIIIVPTLDLVEQWRSRLQNEFEVDIGVFGGGQRVVKALTVSTYDSAFLYAGKLGNKFSFLIFDEVHHLPAPSYSQIAELFASPCRMGLTATYEREDQAHRKLPFLIGGKVYELGVKDLAGTYLSDFDVKRRYVSLTPQEAREYQEFYRKFRRYLQSHNMTFKTHEDFRRFIIRTSWDKAAREALLARNRALNIALNSSSKIEALRRIIVNNPKARILVFTQHNSLVYNISKEFLVPALTHKTEKKERNDILARFRRGEYRVIVTSKLLDEGIDVPDATIGVILSGTGSGREFIQRLGRILRKQEGKKAHLIEIVSKETTETRMSWRRRQRYIQDV